VKNEGAQTVPIVDDHTERMHPDIHPSFGHSLMHALHGVRHVVRHERNARFHLAMAVVVLFASFVLHISGLGLVVLLFAVILVFLSEVFNTAFERTLDLIDTRDNAQIKVIKDMSAGAVLIAAAAAVITGFIVMGPPLARLLWGN
jgi:diacylglycerol kinase (ATP)